MACLGGAWRKGKWFEVGGSGDVDRKGQEASHGDCRGRFWCCDQGWVHGRGVWRGQTRWTLEAREIMRRQRKEGEWANQRANKIRHGVERALGEGWEGELRAWAISGS